MEQIKPTDIEIEVFSDSAYMVNCIQKKWYEKWQKNGWKTSKKGPVENKDLWIKLLNLISPFNVKFHKVAGHSGIELNEMADKLARKGIKELK